MINLSPEHFSKTIKLFEYTIPNSPMLFSVLEGKNPGKVFVNSVENPTQALALLPNSNSVCIGGKFDQKSLNESISFLRKNTDINLYWPSQGFGKLDPPPNSSDESELIEFFDLTDEIEHLKSVSKNIPADCYIHKMDNELIEQCLWRDGIIHDWGSIETFLKNGLGFCLMKGPEILSEAYAPFWGAGYVEIGGRTNEKYRKSGYAYTIFAYLVTKCVDKGFKTRWSTNKDNTASVAVARKLGYKTERELKMIKYERI